MAEHQLHGMSVALVDDQRTVYVAGFGNMHRAASSTGSISKLFNALAVMQQVEQGRIDLNARSRPTARSSMSLSPSRMPRPSRCGNSCAIAPSFIPLVISIRYGHLYAMTENLTDYGLTPVNRNVFAFPAGLYADEHLVFLTGADGKVWGVDLANMTLRATPAAASPQSRCSGSPTGWN